MEGGGQAVSPNISLKYSIIKETSISYRITNKI